jgi:hypothetical protein
MTVAVCSAQIVTSAHSGTLHYFDGDVSIDGAPVQSQVGRFSEIHEQGVLRTGQGRAEVLLTPGVFLRVGENSAIRMLDNRLVSTRVEILSGNVIVESDDPQMTIKDSPVALIYKDYEIQLIKHGLVEIGSDPAQMKVYQGEAVVSTTGSRASVKEGHQVSFSAALLTEKFDMKTGDDLYLWARDRSESVSAANMSSARTLNSNGSGYGLVNGGGYGTGTGYGSTGLGGWNGGWYYNPYFDMYTYVPGGGTFWNAFGYGFFSPGTIYSFYSPTNYWYGGGGARGAGLIGQPLASIGSRGTGAAPLSTLRGGNSGAGSAAGTSAIASSSRGTSATAAAGGHSAAGGAGHGGGHGGR